MARNIPYQVAIGETLHLYVEAMTGDPTAASSLVAKLKAIDSAMAPVPDEGEPSVGTLTVTVQATSPGNNENGTPIMPGWFVMLPASLSAALPAGFYITDMAFQVGGDQDVTEPVVVQIVNAVSLP